MKVLGLRLLKCIYGLHQSNRAWNKKLHNALISMGFVRSKVNPCAYSRFLDGKVFVVLVYVDDLIQVGDSDDDVFKFQSELDKFSPLKHLGRAHFILGIELLWDKDGCLLLRQSTYINDVATRFGVSNAKAPRLPAEPNEHLSVSDGVKLDAAAHATYRSLVGSLLYVSVGTRPDISSALRAVSCFLSSPTSTHLHAPMRILRYLKGTAEKGIKYSPLGNDKFISYADADFANDPDLRRSVSGGESYLPGWRCDHVGICFSDTHCSVLM